MSILNLKLFLNFMLTHSNKPPNRTKYFKEEMLIKTLLGLYKVNETLD